MLPDPQVGKVLSQFITVRYEEGKPGAEAALKKFQVSAFPTLLVLGPDGETWDELGGRDPAAFAKDLERICSGKDTWPSLRADLKASPEDGELALKLAQALSNRHPAEAVALCRQARKNLKPEDAEKHAQALGCEGYAESNLGNWTAALALLAKVIDKYPATDEAGRYALIAMNGVGQVPPATLLAFLAKAMPAVKEEVRQDLLYTQGWLFLEAAKAEWLRRGQAAGEDADLLNNIAWECYGRGWHTDEALLWARKAVSLSKRAPHILDTLAHLLARKGDLDEAIKLEEEALAGCTEASMGNDFEEALAKFKAVQTVRAARTDVTAK